MAVGLALLTSIGVAGIPAASLIAIVVILQALGLPQEAVAIILVVDRPLDMLRTGVNILGDAVTSKIIDHRFARKAS
jgi:Na+/H+-dicarboxylate symporter